MEFTVRKLELEKDHAVIGMERWDKIDNNPRLSVIEVKIPTADIGSFSLGQKFKLEAV
jgi:hypothetical protein